MEEENKKQTIETITKAYEEKIANREKEFEEEKKKMQETSNKAIADIILGRKEIKEVQNNDEEENDKSFFDKMVEETKKNLGITKEEKK